MKNKPSSLKVCSVIVPIYNAERYLAECLRSLIGQTYSALQILLIDDGSTDGSAAIAADFARQDSRIELIRTPNQGQAAARNIGLEQASGEWVLMVDADDYLEKDCIEKLTAAIGESDVLQYGYRYFTAVGQTLYTLIPRHAYRLTAPWSRLYRRAFLEQNGLRFPTGHIYEDVRFSMLLWAARPKQAILPYVGYHYRKNAGSTTSRRHREEEKELYRDLRRTGKGLRMFILRWYTIGRLKLHFWREQHRQDLSDTPNKP